MKGCQSVNETKKEEKKEKKEKNRVVSENKIILFVILFFIKFNREPSQKNKDIYAIFFLYFFSLPASQYAN